MLRDEFLREKIRANRAYDIVIVDEADSMLVDGINHMVRLSSPIPGMINLLPILITVWTELNSLDEENQGEENYELATIINLNRRMAQRMEQLKEHSHRSDLSIPEYMMDFVTNNRLHVWITNAYHAKHSYTEGKDYIIRNGEIKIVDLYNTGIVFDNMRLTDGTHQFLQLKHDVHLTSEELVTNFLGNPTFFYKYGGNIYGLSGTLGCDNTKKFLELSYGVESIVIPPFTPKQHTPHNSIAMETRKDWYNAIVHDCITQRQAHRVVMIIAESINETNAIKELLKQQGVHDVLMYQSDEDSSIAQKRHGGGQVIIATNICGRGVNIVLTDEANRRGGLHICLTFLPENDRVQRQNIGRTSRTGNPGSSQIIVLSETCKTFKEITDARDLVNAEKLMRSASEMEKIKAKSQVFEKFCKLLNFTEGTQLFTDDLQNDLVRECVKEKFGIWLKENEVVTDQNFQDILPKFELLEASIKSNFAPYPHYAQLRLTNNCYFYIKSGMQYMRARNNEKAHEQLTKAIQIDDKLAAFAYVNRSIVNNSLNRTREALYDLKVSRDHIEAIKAQHKKLQAEVPKNNPRLIEKFGRKIELLDITDISIIKAINDLERNDRENYNSLIKYKNWLLIVESYKQVEDSKRLYLMDGKEMIQSGWMGPIEVTRGSSKAGRWPQIF